MSQLFYLSEDMFFCLKDNKINPVPCDAVAQYKKTLQELKQRKAWKTKGAGAQFMGMGADDADDFSHIFFSDLVLTDAQTMIYSARLQEGTAIYARPLADGQPVESVVLRKQDFIVHDMSYDRVGKKLILSAGEPYQYARHLCILGVDDSRVHYVTEGDCQDANPVMDPQHPDCVFYDSCGFGYDQQGNMMSSAKEICRLNLKTGALDVLVSDAKYDLFKPQHDTQGNLYFLQRPYRYKSAVTSITTTIKDLLISPIKIIKAIVGWLDFFTQRYTGESLKTSGANPAKMKQKSEEELFIEGNLIKVHDTIKQNAQAGEKYPGMIPSSWQLMKQTPSGDIVTVKKGVLSYALQGDSIVYSNGKYLIEIAANQQETMLVESKLVTKIIC